MSTSVCKLRYHHGGKLLRAPTVQYINGSEVEYDEDIDCICYWTVLGAVKSLGYDIGMAVKVYYVEEGKPLDGGLKLILDDKGVLEMTSQLRKTKVVDIYVEHLDEKVSGTMLPGALRQPIEGAEQSVSQGSEACQLPRTPFTPRFDDSDTNPERDENENESESGEDLAVFKEVPSDKKDDKVPFSLRKHLSLETNKTKTMEGDIDGELILSEGREVEVASDEEGLRGAWFTCTILKLLEDKTKGKVLVQYKHLLEDDNQTPLTESVELSFIRPLPPELKIPGDQCFEINDVVDAFHLDGWWTGSVSEVIDNLKRYIVSFPDPPEKIEFSSSNLRPHWKWDNGRWVKPSKFQEVSSSDRQKLELSCNIVRDAEANIQLGSPDAVKSSSKKHEHFRVISKKNKMSPLMASIEPAKSKQVRQSTRKGDSTSLHPSKKLKHEMNLQKEHGMSRHRKEDGLLESRQPKSVLRITRSPPVEAESSVISGLELAGSQTMSIERAYSRRKITKVAGESGRVLQEKEEQPQIICHGNDSGDFPPGFENQWNDPREKPLESMVQSPLAGLSGDNERVEGQGLPFVKSLEIWKAVESMEIFKVMPQNPHFRQLVQSKEILREGLAVAYTLNFASLVQKTSELTVAGPRNLFTTILDVLPEFEILGFNVKAVRDRTSELLKIKDRHGHLQQHSKEVVLQGKQYSDELTKINEEIDANQKRVRELEEKQALLLQRKKSKIAEIASLKVCADDTTKDIQNVEADFENLAGSSW
ncbi:Detected protein of unknown function [Hibiscus syriacus]|uniref:Agenet domain-containing protein n=1 Tax=Hibiscus syriacus TaxID=106335 RepID=A0A6A2Y144_HIBSY|nr:DUF724 domain-containing protein 10-like [Hibiscus syriacus]KAE8673865.1 Detected protein of unknown function [Hibiscus syriacus]